MHPGKLPLLIILLATLGICAAALFGRSGGRWSALAKALSVALLGSLACASAYFGIAAVLRGSVSLAKHGTALTFSAADSPLMYFAVVAGVFLLSLAMLCAAIRVAKGRLYGA